MAHYLLMDAGKQNENMEVISPWREAYRKHLVEALMMNRTRILSFKSKPPAPTNAIFKEVFLDNISNYQLKSVKPRRYIFQVRFLSFLDSLMPGLIFLLCVFLFLWFLFVCILDSTDHSFLIDLIAVSGEDIRCTGANRWLLSELAWLEQQQYCGDRSRRHSLFMECFKQVDFRAFEHWWRKWPCNQCQLGSRWAKYCYWDEQFHCWDLGHYCQPKGVCSDLKWYGSLPLVVWSQSSRFNAQVPHFQLNY